MVYNSNVNPSKSKISAGFPSNPSIYKTFDLPQLLFLRFFFDLGFIMPRLSSFDLSYIPVRFKLGDCSPGKPSYSLIFIYRVKTAIIGLIAAWVRFIDAPVALLLLSLLFSFLYILLSWISSPSRIAA